MLRLLLFFFAIALLRPVAARDGSVQHGPAVSRVFSGRVVRVADGDTIAVLVGWRTVKVRFFGIDCPEMGQPFGQAAKGFTSNLLFGKTVQVSSRGRDRYGRELGVVRAPGGAPANEALLGAGLAWWYRRYAPHETRLQAAEQQARTARRGLWADANPVQPWQWRRQRR